MDERMLFELRSGHLGIVIIQQRINIIDELDFVGTQNRACGKGKQKVHEFHKFFQRSGLWGEKLDRIAEKVEEALRPLRGHRTKQRFKVAHGFRRNRYERIFKRFAVDEKDPAGAGCLDFFEAGGPFAKFGEFWGEKVQIRFSLAVPSKAPGASELMDGSKFDKISSI